MREEEKRRGEVESSSRSRRGRAEGDEAFRIPVASGEATWLSSE